MSRLQEHPGLWTLSSILIVPFLLFGLGFIEFIYFLAALIILLYILLLVLNFEAGFLTLIFIRSSLDYMKGFSADGAVNVAGIISLLLIVLGFFYTLYRKVSVFKFQDSLFYILFLVICASSISHSPNLKESFSDWLRLLSVFSVYVLTRTIFITQKKIKVALTIVLCSSLFPILGAYIQLITRMGGIMDGGQYRVIGTFLHPNALASYLIVILVFCMAQILEKERFIHRGFLWFLVLSGLGVFLFTFSRGAWIVFIVSMFLMGVLRYRKILALLPILLITVVFTIPSVRDRVMDVVDPSYTKGRSAWEWRLDTWEQIGDLVKQKPWLGHGLSMVENEFGILTHNDYLRLLAEVGILGLFAYLLLAFNLIKTTWQDYWRSESKLVKSFQMGLFAVIVGFLIREFADNTLRNTVVMLYFWIFVALVRNLALIEKQSLKQAQLQAQTHEA